RRRLSMLVMTLCLNASAAWAQTGSIMGTVRDETGGVLPGTVLELDEPNARATATVTSDGEGTFRFGNLPAGRYQLVATLPGFGVARRVVSVQDASLTSANLVMHLSLSTEVTVTGKGTFSNLADVEDPASNLVGVAHSASQGAITGRQLDV